MYLIILLLVILFAFLACYFSRRAPEKLTTSGSIVYTNANIGGIDTVIQTLTGDSDDVVVLLHLSPMNQTIWNPLFDYFQGLAAAGKKIPTLISYDLRGHGTAWTPVPSQYNDNDVNNTMWSFDDFAADLKQVYDLQVKSGKITLVGYGFGGSVAQEFALRYPKLVKELILLNAFVKPLPNDAERKEHLEYITDVLDQYPGIDYVPHDDKLVKRFLCTWFDIDNKSICPNNNTDKSDQSNTPAFNMAEMMLRQAPLATHLQADKLLMNIDFSRRWKNAKPDYGIRIVTGTRDTLTPSDMMARGYDVIRHVRPDVGFATIDGKHAFVLTKPNEVAHIICPQCSNSDTPVKGLLTPNHPPPTTRLPAPVLKNV